MSPKKMIRCEFCQRWVPANPRIKNQKCCGRKKCQQARKTEWNRQKIKNDQEYSDRKNESGKKWQEKNRDYWGKYRANNQEYCDRNRELQKKRDLKRKENNVKTDESNSGIDKMDTSESINFINTNSCDISDSNLAKMDALDQINLIKPGIYCICAGKSDLAKMDALNNKFLIIPVINIDLAKMDKIDIHQIPQYLDDQNHQIQEVNYEDRKKTNCDKSNSKN